MQIEKFIVQQQKVFGFGFSILKSMQKSLKSLLRQELQEK